MIIVGGFNEVIEQALDLRQTILGVVDVKPDLKVLQQYNLQFLGNDEYVLENMEKYKIYPFFLTPDIPQKRRTLYSTYSQHGAKFLDIISAKSNISTSARIEYKTSIMIQDSVNISSNVQIGKCVRINTFANIMHDCIIRDFSTIAPNAVLLGNVEVEENTYIGANATILPNITIGKNAIVGAGAVVTRNVQNGTTVVGNPAKKM